MLAACLLLLVLLTPAASATAQVQVIPGHWAAGAQPDGNSVVFEGPDGLVVFDTGRHVAHAQRLLQAIRDRGRPLRWIVNSHWHLDHLGGNRPLRTAHPQARVLAGDGVLAARTGFLARYRAQLLERLAALPPGDAEHALVVHELALIDDRASQAPDVSVQATTERSLAGRRFIVGLARHAVTATDVWLFDTATRTLASGDLVTLPVPFLDTACAERWQAALDDLAALPFDRLVPGHGATMDRTGFQRYRLGFAELRRCAAGSASNARCTDGWLAALGDLVPAEQQADARTYLGYYLDQHLRAPPSRARAHCPA